MRRSTIWRMIFVLLSLALIAWLLWLFGTSDSFGHCVKQRKNYQPYQALHKETFFLVKIAIRLNLNAACAVHVTNQYQGAITALAGVVVAAFTGTLWWVTWGMVRIAAEQRADTLRAIIASENAAVASQAAASTAERALFDLERAYVFAAVYPDGDSIRKPVPFGPGLFDYAIKIEFTNYGKTPAVIRRVRGYAKILPQPPTDLVEFKGSEKTVPPGLVIAVGEPYTIRVPFRGKDQEWIDLMSWNETLYCVGLIDYRDIFGNDRSTGYCWRLFPQGSNHAFAIAESTLNYQT